MRKQILMLLLAAAVSAGLIYATYQQALDRAYTEEFDSAARTLRIERSQVEAELSEVNSQLKQVVIGKGCTCFIFEELYEELYTDVLPVMMDYGYTGVLALSDTFFPGQEGCITVEQFDYLTSHGWTTCLYYDDYVTLPHFLKQMQSKLDSLELEMPKAICLAAGDYRSFKDKQLLDAGFTTVIHHGEEGDLITRQDDDELFLVGASGWNISTVKTTLEDVSSYGGSVALFVDFSTPSGMFVEDWFENMCKFLKSQSKTLYLSDIDGLRSNLSMVDQNQELLNQKAFLESEIQRYDNEITAIYQLNPRKFAH